MFTCDMVKGVAKPALSLLARTPESCQESGVGLEYLTCQNKKCKNFSKFGKIFARSEVFLDCHMMPLPYFWGTTYTAIIDLTHNIVLIILRLYAIVVYGTYVDIQ